MKFKTLILFLALAGLLPLTAQAQVNYAVSGNTAYVTNSPDAFGNIVIASNYDGYPVMSIGDFAFAYCYSLTNVTIGTNIRSIGDYAFWYCTGLTNITIPNSVTSIGIAAFEWGSLTSVTIPNSVTNIGDGAFNECLNVTNITVAAGNPAYSSVNGVLFDKEQTMLIQFPGRFVGSYIVPDSVTNISNGAFAFCLRLTRVVIPNSVTSIGEDVFSECADLTNITFLGNAPALGSGVFDYDLATVIYHYYGTSGWGSTYGGLPTVELAWTPQIVGGVKAQSNGFGFTVIGTNGMPFIVEASTNLVEWQPVWTNSLSGASAIFTDSQWTNYPARFYRAR